MTSESERSEPVGSRKRALQRRRRANVAGGRHHRHVVRVTPEEEAVLAQLAAAHRVSVPRLLVESTLSRDAGETPTERRDALAEMYRAVRLLASITNNVNQMTRAANATGELAAEMSVTLARARETAQRITASIDRAFP